MYKAYFFTVGLFLLLIMASSCDSVRQMEKEKQKKDVYRTPYFQISLDPDQPGCGECHKNPEKREDTLAAKANEKWEDHNFNINEDMMTINDCLLCHSVENKGEEGVIAPTPLRSIVHRGHMPSPRFGGNCFTCHYIMGDGSPDLYRFSD